MATYEYKCPDHGSFDKIHPIGQNPKQEICPICGQWSNQQILATPAIFKGSGWGADK